MLLLIVALFAADPTAAPSPSPSPPEDQAQADYERAEQLYNQSCADRSYGAYDDLCDQLKTQMHAYRVQLDRAERAAAEKRKTPAPK